MDKGRMEVGVRLASGGKASDVGQVTRVTHCDVSHSTAPGESRAKPAASLNAVKEKSKMRTAGQCRASLIHSVCIIMLLRRSVTLGGNYPGGSFIWCRTAASSMAAGSSENNTM